MRYIGAEFNNEGKQVPVEYGQNGWCMGKVKRRFAEHGNAERETEGTLGRGMTAGLKPVIYLSEPTRDVFQRRHTGN